jgi:hypothetical protein
MGVSGSFRRTKEHRRRVQYTSVTVTDGDTGPRAMSVVEGRNKAAATGLTAGRHQDLRECLWGSFGSRGC